VRLRNPQFVNPKIYILAIFTQSNLQFYILQRIRPSNNFQIVGTIFSPEQNQPRNPKTLISSQIDSRRLAGNHHRQAVHQKPRNWVGAQVLPGDQARTARRFLIWNPENKQNCMCRLTAHSKPPGDFWNFPEIQNSRYLATRNNVHSFHTSIINQLQISYEFSTPNLDSSLWNWLLAFFLGSTMIFSLASTQPHVATFPFSQLAQCMLC